MTTKLIADFDSDTAMPTSTPALTTATVPSSTVTTRSTTVVMLVTVTQHNTKKHDREECKEGARREWNDERQQGKEEGDEGGKDLEEEMMSREENDERQQRTEEHAEIRENIKENKGEQREKVMDEARTLAQMTNNNTTCQPTPFDWVEEVDAFLNPSVSSDTTATALTTVEHPPHSATTVDTTPTVVVTPVLPTVHGPCDLSALHSGMSNPWGSIKH